MKINTRMPETIRSFYLKELIQSDNAYKNGAASECWYHLERAHILGQPYPIEHTRVHWKMLLFGIRMKNIKEIIGQLPRLLVGGVKSFVGKIPVGNTGGANVPGLLEMNIPADLKEIINNNIS
jgi:hypothetical protein